MFSIDKWKWLICETGGTAVSWRPAVTLTYNLQNLIRSSVSFTEIAQAIHEIYWQQDPSGQTNE